MHPKSPKACVRLRRHMSEAWRTTMNLLAPRKQRPAVALQREHVRAEPLAAVLGPDAKLLLGALAQLVLKVAINPIATRSKRADVVGLYMNPPDQALAVCASTKRAKFRRWIAPSRAFL